MKVTILTNAEAVAKKAASLIAAEARTAVLERGRFVMAISGGKTPWMMLRFLAQEEDVPWADIAIFQVDERIAPAGSTDRNYTHLQESLLSHAPLQPHQIHPMPVNADNLEEATHEYSDLIKQIAGSPPVFDLVHLGLGADGHTASLIPGDPILKVNDTDVALTGVYQGHHRMSLTYPVINRSRSLLWVVTGKEKQEALQQLFRKDRTIPAGSILQENALLLADSDAAGTITFAEEKALKVGIAADHGGFALKQDLISRLQFLGYAVTDFGASTLSPEDDYPDYGIPLGRAIAAGTVDRGIAICGSGVGISVCINKIPGVRAALINDHFSAKQGVEDDHINTICLGGRTLGHEVAWDLVRTFLHSSYSQEKRHLRRLGKVSLLEKE